MMFVGHSMQTSLHTFGYEGLSIEAFLVRLKAVGVKTVIDVRANPISRKRGFSKRSFATALTAAGLTYSHLPAMGCPKNVRDQYKLDQDWANYTEGFLAYLDTQPTALADLIAIARTASSCLVCFEADYNKCHRKFVARAAAEIAAFQVRHLTNQEVIAEEALRSAA
jgi:uncharacterized protein (DUF488 family)